jgi:hypothetical protein
MRRCRDTRSRFPSPTIQRVGSRAAREQHLRSDVARAVAASPPPLSDLPPPPDFDVRAMILEMLHVAGDDQPAMERVMQMTLTELAALPTVVQPDVETHISASSLVLMITNVLLILTDKLQFPDEEWPPLVDNLIEDPLRRRVALAATACHIARNIRRVAEEKKWGALKHAAEKFMDMQVFDSMSLKSGEVDVAEFVALQHTIGKTLA